MAFDRKLILAASVIGATVAVTSNALACSCATQTPAADILAGSDWVAEITVTRVPPITIGGPPPQMTAQILWEFKPKVLRLQGTPPPLLQLNYQPGPPTGGPGCEMTPNVNATYLVWGKAPPAFAFKYCANFEKTKKTIDGYVKLRAEFDALSKPEKAPLKEPNPAVR